ncbi:hypothetical protein J1N35_005083 [Gossypium stocksii]|uniref:Uncharacterized protein n=1 Tax=Gossypium stocksii TaxID=47602 RepID=A0A9D4AIN5_9ROSI|nr:hypothetical protein J1N35_005083 [Gossypium stocksii]
MGRYSSVSGIDFNFGTHSIHQLGYLCNLNFDTRAQHSVNAFDFNYNGLMSWAKSSCTSMSSTYTYWHSSGDFDRNVEYRRTDDLFSMLKADEGTFNPLDENENKDAAEEEDASTDKGAADGVDGSKYDPNPIWLSGETVQCLEWRELLCHKIPLEKIEVKCSIRDDRCNSRSSKARLCHDN